MNSKILLLLVGIVIGGIYVTFRFTGQIWGVKTRIIMKKDYFLGREYGVLPRWMQFIVFIHSGLFGGGGGKWRFSKLKRVFCWYGIHEYPPEYNKHIKIQESVKIKCTRCGFVTKLIDNSSYQPLD